MATALSTARKKSIRDKLKAKVKTAGYKKGHVAQTTGKKIKDIKIKKKEKTDLKTKFKGKTDSAAYKKAAEARKYARKHKKAMHSDDKKATTQKSYRKAASEGAKVSHAKKVGKASVAAGKPKGPGLKYTQANKDWRAAAMKRAKSKTGLAKKKAMQDVDRKYRKKVGLKKKTYT
jgi:hypothetical protein